MKILYFTGTGNSLYVAKKIGGDLLSIPQLVKENIYELEDDVIGIIAPVYMGEVPQMVQRYLSKANFKTDYLFIIATYGGVSPNVLGYANKVMGSRKFDYGNTIKMIDNFLPFFDISKEKEKKSSAEIDSKIEKICQDIQNRKKTGVKGNVFGKLLGGIEHIAYPLVIKSDFAKTYNINEKCNLCGTCQRVCPAGNIKVSNQVEFSDCCEVCFACIHNCPQNAIHLKKEKSADRFRNEDILLGEIINANNQK